jgi:hypothetical protein
MSFPAVRLDGHYTAAANGLPHHPRDYDRFAMGFMACLMMVMMLYYCMYAVGKVQRAYLVETATP